MAKSIKTKQVGQTSAILTDEAILVEVPIEELSDEEKIINYISNSHSDKVDLTPLLKSLYPLPTISEPALYLRQTESKRIKILLSQLKLDGKISLDNDSFLKLATHYYKENEVQTKYHTIESVKIIAVK